MLNRRILRIKAFKTVYSLAENPSMSAADALDQLECSCQATRDLYLFMLNIIPALTGEALARIEAARSKFNPSEEEAHPNMKFVNNSIAPLLAEDPDFTKLISKKHLDWSQYDVLLRHVFDNIRKSDYYKAYMNSGKAGDFSEDAGLWVSIFENEFSGNAELADILEDLSIWWNDDLEYALSYCCRTMDDFARKTPWALPELYLSQMPGQEGKDSDRDFVRSVVKRAVSDFTADVDAICALTPRWDRDRICTTDLALIVCGMAEQAAFPQVAARIIMNEYVEISKFYSTPQSSAFVNGLLDKLINKKQ